MQHWVSPQPFPLPPWRRAATAEEVEKAMYAACKETSGFPEFTYANDMVTPKMSLFTACIGTAKAGAAPAAGGGGGGGGGGGAPAPGPVAEAPPPEPEEEEEENGVHVEGCRLSAAHRQWRHAGAGRVDVGRAWGGLVCCVLAGQNLAVLGGSCACPYVLDRSSRPLPLIPCAFVVPGAWHGMLAVKKLKVTLRLQLPGASGSRRSASAHLHLPVSVPVSGSIHAVCCSFVLVSCVFPVFRFRVDVASAVFSISILSLDAAKDRPITDTDVQSDGRPLALPGNSHGALPLRDEVAAAGPTH
eukprot:scaffold5664_cov115-Isochrysis_galbana.AAC.24